MKCTSTSCPELTFKIKFTISEFWNPGISGEKKFADMLFFSPKNNKIVETTTKISPIVFLLNIY
jgi:hypothetical protein